MNYSLTVDVVVLVVSTAILVRAGDHIVRTLIYFAGLFSVSEYVVSFVLMSFATTLPEFAISTNSALIGEPILAVGTVLGSNVVNLGLILGLVVLLSGSVSIDKNVASRDAWLTFGLGALPAFLMLDFQLSRLDGVLLLFFFMLYMMYLLKLHEFLRERKGLLPAFREKLRVGNVGELFRNLTVFILAAAAILISAHFVVDAGEDLSIMLNVPGLLIGVFVFAIGTSLPELSFGLRAAFAKHGGLSLGNLMGASVFNSTLILGLTALIHPVTIAADFGFLLSLITMIVLLFLANLFMRTRDSISRREGVVLIAVYVVFALVLFS